MKNIYKAIANLQQKIEPIVKDTQGFGYKFADLPAVLKILNPLMKENGLGFYQAVNGTSIKTVIFHIESGEIIESVTDIPQGVQLAKMNEFQVLGSAITYIRRYALSSLLGLVTDVDNDASGEQIDYKKKESKPPVMREKKPLELSEVLLIIEKENNIDILQTMYSRLDSSINIKEEDKATVSKALEDKIESLS